MSAVRLYVDEDASESAVVTGLRARGVDPLTTAEAGREGTADEQQLEFAAQEGRALYTSVGEKIRAVAAVVQANTVESLKDRIEFL